MYFNSFPVGISTSQHIDMESNDLITFLGSPEFVEASSKSSRLINKLKAAIEKKELYETHQIIRTIHFRFLNSKDKVTPLRDLLYHAARYLFDNKEYQSGQDVATLFLEASANSLASIERAGNEKNIEELSNNSLSYHTNNKTIDWELSSKIAKLAIELPESEIGLKKYLADALKILVPKMNKSIFHEILAKNFWQNKNLPNSRYNYLHCANLENARDIAQLLVEYHLESANKDEIDLFLTQFILQFLCLQKISDQQPSAGSSNQQKSVSSTLTCANPKTRSSIKNIAEKIFTSYLLEHPQLSQESVPYTSLPLLNFTHFIISMLTSTQETENFITLRNVYKATWSRDPNYETYLNRIGYTYFGLPDPSQQRQGGFLNNMLQSLFEPGEDGEDVPLNPADSNESTKMDDLD